MFYYKGIKTAQSDANKANVFLLYKSEYSTMKGSVQVDDGPTISTGI